MKLHGWKKGGERLILQWKKMAFLWNNKQSLNSTSLERTPSFPFIKMTVCRHILQLEGEAAAGDSFKNRPNLENDSNVSQMLYPPNLACETLKRAVTGWGIEMSLCFKKKKTLMELRLMRSHILAIFLTINIEKLNKTHIASLSEVVYFACKKGFS